MTSAEMRALAADLRDVARRADEQAGRLEGLADREEGGRGVVRPFVPRREHVCPNLVDWCGTLASAWVMNKVRGSHADFCSRECRSIGEPALAGVRA